MSITRLLVLPLLISVCVSLTAHAQAVAGPMISPMIKCPPEQVEPVPFKNPFQPTAASEQLPLRADGLNVADVTAPLEFRRVQQHDLILVDANGVLRRVPLHFPCGFYVYLSTNRPNRLY